MTSPALPTRTRLALPVVALSALALALVGCAGAPAADPTSAAPAASDGVCADVAVVVEFGELGADPIDACTPAGSAQDVLAAAGVDTEGTADYGDQVVCRVNQLPSPDAESCATLPADGYWALWVKADPGADWEYAQEGVATLQLEAGQSVGLVYTTGTDSTPPEG